MSTPVASRTRRCCFGRLAVILLALACGAAAAQNAALVAPAIRLTSVPRGGAGPNTSGNIAGTAAGVNFRTTRVVIYSKGGDTYYVQPTTAAPKTSIGASGRWSRQIHLGWYYVALLVRSSYAPPATFFTIPQVGGDVLAVAVSYPRDVRVIHWSGNDWAVKRDSGPLGPGPNFFLDDSRNVFLDAQGRLHLKITLRNGHWQCSEVISLKSFGFGTYYFFLDSPASKVDTNAVLGMFTYDFVDPSDANGELDVEISRFGDPQSQNAQFVVQPFDLPGHRERFEMPSVPTSTHSFDWRSDHVTFRSVRGHQMNPPNPLDVVHEATLTDGIPPASGENARINLWLFNARPPTTRREVEVILSGFAFVPAS